MIGRLHRRWRRSWGPEAVLHHRVSTVSKSVALAVADHGGLGEILWRVDDLQMQLDRQLGACSRLSGPMKPIVLRDLERSVARFEEVGRRIVAAASRSVSCGVTGRLEELDRHVALIETAYAELESLDRSAPASG
jgi:hypothetical protein